MMKMCKDGIASGTFLLITGCFYWSLVSLANDQQKHSTAGRNVSTVPPSLLATSDFPCLVMCPLEILLDDFCGPRIFVTNYAVDIRKVVQVDIMRFAVLHDHQRETRVTMTKTYVSSCDTWQ